MPKPLRAPHLRLMSLLFLIGMTNGCVDFFKKSKPDVPQADQVILVDTNEITENPDGTYTVSKGWMLNRLYVEDALESALDACLRGEL